MRGWIIAHRWAGYGGLVAFLASGWYMELHDPAMQQLPDGIRMMFRSRHIYLLLASLINVVLAAYLEPRGRRSLQWAGSAAIVLAPILLAVGFLREPYVLGRNFTTPTAALLLAGALAHAAGARRRDTAPKSRAAAAK